MSTPFRQKFDAARKAYASLKYPGDLATQMLAPAPQARSRWILAGLGAAAVAAMVTVLVLVNPSGKTNNSPKGNDALVMAPQTAPPAEQVQPITLADLPGMRLPSADALLEMAPRAPVLGFDAAPDFSFSAPSFSLIRPNENSQQETPNPTGAVYVPSNQT
jgi:hypothetical protein